MNCPICSHPSLPLLRRNAQLGSVHMASEDTRDILIHGCRACDFVWNDAAFSNPDEFNK